MTIENVIKIYTDGSSFSHPRSGGIGIRFVIVDSIGNETFEDLFIPGYKGATNNQMGLNACIIALQKIVKHAEFPKYWHIIIYSDSQYVVDNYARALFQWPKNKWRNNYGKPVENAELWKKLIAQVTKCKKRIEFKWVKGHAKDQHNKAVDKLAKRSAKQATNKPLAIEKIRRKLSEKSVEVGSVSMSDQKISIRIISDKYLKSQKCYRYKYEVISKNSPFKNDVDIIYSDILLNAGHSYFVRLNNDQKNPQILKLYKEIEKK